MHIMRLVKLLLTVGIVISLIIGFIVPSTIANDNIIPTDGIWEDSFSDNSSVWPINCVVQNGTIVLNQEAIPISYNFTQKGIHEAFFYRSFFFFPTSILFSPKIHPKIHPETEIMDNGKMQMEEGGQILVRNSGFKNKVILHCRFKVDMSAEIINTLNVKWSGKADANAYIKIYYYNYSYTPYGGWIKLETWQSNGSYKSMSNWIYGYDVKYALDIDNYIDICVVAGYHIPGKTCTLSTDFIGLRAHTTKGYTLKNASVETKNVIDPNNISKFSNFNWEFLTWDDYQPTGTEIRYHILYKKNGGYTKVEDAVLPGNDIGFNISPVPLNNLSNFDYGNKYNKLKIRAYLSTSNPSISPQIFSWALTWQNKTRWQDLFSTYYRIDKRTKIIIENETILISKIQDEWPLFGFDSLNNRASSCKGAAIANRYWYSKENTVGGKFRNPVIGNGKVYIFSKTSLHQYNVVLPSGLKEGDAQANISSINIGYDIVNSPAVTEDLVIVATGQQGDGGHENHIYGYQTKNLTQKWDYFDPNDPKICYDASPVVADDTIYISTWGGDNGSHINKYTNNKLLALDLSTGKKKWDYPLPAPSFSTPAVTTDMIIVGCNSPSPENDSVIALTLNGEKIWSKAVGAVGHASPVVVEDTVFITCKQVIKGIVTKVVTKIIALNINEPKDNLWNVTIGVPSSIYDNVAESTPAVYNGILYAASPDGTLYALNTSNGDILWSKSVYTLPIFSKNILLSSPAYADNHIYIGTPEGKIYAIDTAKGNISSGWPYMTFANVTNAAVLGSPVVSNGLVFIADEEGYLYSIGKFKMSTNEVTGQIISTPIRLPEALWWNTFYADVSYNASLSSIMFKLLDENGNILMDSLTNRSAFGGQILNRTVRLQADFSAKNITKDNPKLLRWYITLTSDTQKPFLDSSSFTPDSKGWIREIPPVFTIKVKDNHTGLRVKSARYFLKNTQNNITQNTSAFAACTGENGTTEVQLMTMDISKLPDFKNITSIHSITFTIMDLAGNTASKTVTFKQDTKKPTSNIKTLFMKQRYNSSYVLINATANDTGTLNVDASGIKLVELYYRYSPNNNFSGKWILFSNSTKSVPSWRFNFTNRPNQPGGYYELCTVATDNASHVEDFPSKGDLSFLYDWKAPSLPSISGDTLWFKERPQFSVIFEDDFRLDTIQYRPNFETEWTTIASRVNKSIYNTDASGNSWILLEKYWNFMTEGEIYYLYFKINDTLGNTLFVTNNNEAIVIRKDLSKPNISIDIPSVETKLTWDNNFTVVGLGSDHAGSGIKEALLYYRYSEDNLTWSNWSTYGETFDSPPFSWDFEAIEGDGYYQLKINVTDYAGNAEDSEVRDVIVASFPTTLALVMVGLIVALLFISMIIFLKWRRKK